MNPIKWIYNDLKEDVKTIGYIYRQLRDGKPILDPEKKRIFIQGLKEAPRTLIKESWYWLLAIIFALAMGAVVGEHYCTIKCNNFIVQEFYDRDGDGILDSSGIVSPGITILPGGPGYEDSEGQNYTEGSPVHPFG